MVHGRPSTHLLVAVVLLLVQMLVVVVDQSAGQLDTVVAGHRLHACPCEDAYGLRGDCHDTRGSLAGCLHRATISAFRFRSSQSGKWNLPGLVSITSNHYMIESYVAAAP